MSLSSRSPHHVDTAHPNSLASRCPLRTPSYASLTFSLCSLWESLSSACFRNVSGLHFINMFWAASNCKSNSKIKNIQRLCRPQEHVDSVVWWRHQGPRFFLLLCFAIHTSKIGSPWQFQMATSGSQKVMFFLTRFPEDRETSLISPFLSV